MLTANLINRLKHSLTLAGWHLLACIGIASLIAGLVFWIWFPYPYREMVGIGHLFWVIIAVDVVCGPLLTLILANPRKSRRETCIDFLLIGSIQLAALGYGMYSVALSRPVADVFEVDRIVVITQREVLQEPLKKTNPQYTSLPWFSRLQVASDLSKESTLDGLDLSLQGISPAMRPATWEPLDSASASVEQALRPIAELEAAYPETQAKIAALAKQQQREPSDIYFLPFTYDKTFDWVVLMDKKLTHLGYLQADGFIDRPEFKN